MRNTRTATTRGNLTITPDTGRALAWKTALVDVVEEGLLALDTQGRITFANRGAERILGRAAHELVNERASDLLCAWPDGGAVGASSTARFPGLPGPQRHAEDTLVRGDGTLFPVAFSTLPVHRDDQVEGHVVSFRDVSDRKGAEDARRRLEGIVKSSSDAIVTLTAEGRVLSWNTGAENLFGFTADEMVGDSIRKIIPPEKQDESTALLARVAAGESVQQYTARRQHKDGTPIDVSLTASPVQDARGRTIALSGIYRDVSDAKRALSMLEGQTRVLEKVATGASLPEALEAIAHLIESTTDMRASVLLVDETEACLRGGAAPTLPATFNNALDGLPVSPDVGPCANAAFAKTPVVMTDMATDPRWATFRDLATSHGLRACWSTPILSRDGDVLGTFALYDNAPRAPTAREEEIVAKGVHLASIAIERARADERLRRLNETLERRVMERTRELEETNEELESFSYSVSHDLRAPLRGIAFLSRALKEDASERLTDEENGYVDRLSRESERLTLLVSDLLQLATVGRTELNRTRVDLAEVARDVVETLQRAHPDRDVTVEIGENLTVDADPELTRVLLENLIGNAWKFTGRTPDARIHVGRAELDGESAFCVSDNGPGFDPAKAETLFKPFTRLHAANGFEGTGVGLATVERIVRRHGGRVTASGRPGKGATFCVTL